MFRLMLEEYLALDRLRDNIVQQAEAALVFELWGVTVRVSQSGLLPH